MTGEPEMLEDMLSPWRGERDSDQCLLWSSGYDTCPDSDRSEFDPPLRHRFFRTLLLIRPVVTFQSKILLACLQSVCSLNKGVYRVCEKIQTSEKILASAFVRCG